MHQQQRHPHQQKEASEVVSFERMHSLQWYPISQQHHRADGYPCKFQNRSRPTWRARRSFSSSTSVFPIASRINGPANNRIPVRPSTPPTSPPRVGKCVASGSFNAFAAHACASLATVGENSTLTCVFSGTLLCSTEASLLFATSSAAFSINHFGSSWPVTIKVFGGVGGTL